jgi:hypothetical protein
MIALTMIGISRAGDDLSIQIKSDGIREHCGFFALFFGRHAYQYADFYIFQGRF